jgi:hypothetical protein
MKVMQYLKLHILRLSHSQFWVFVPALFRTLTITNLRVIRTRYLLVGVFKPFKGYVGIYSLRCTFTNTMCNGCQCAMGKQAMGNIAYNQVRLLLGLMVESELRHNGIC